MKKPLVLIVDDDPALRDALALVLEDAYETIRAGDGAAALDAIRSGRVDMALLDIALPGMNGLEVLRRIREADPDVGVVMLSATDKAGVAIKALKTGAFDYITKPFDCDDLRATLKRCMDSRALNMENHFLKEEVERLCNEVEMMSMSPAMQGVFGIARKVAATSSNVLIQGESGTGKELVARAVHAMGPRKERPFVAVNCGAVPADLMESEFFGHEKGAFTGAHARRIGRFEYADTGTVFLDEVATLPMHLQTKLLRVLQERTFERVGGCASIKVDVRIISATNADLCQEVERGRFREDLFWRLKVVPITLPPLRERKEDIALLASSFLEHHGKKNNKKISGISDEAVSALERYPWPGNIRELENVMERLVVLLANGSAIGREDLPFEILCFDPGCMPDQKQAGAIDLKDACRAFERGYIVNMLNETRWNRSEAARIMNIHRNTLLLKMKEHGLKYPGPTHSPGSPARRQT